MTKTKEGRYIWKLDWDDIQGCVDDILARMDSKEFEPDGILCVGRGGMVASAMIANKLGIMKVHYLGVHRDPVDTVALAVPFVTIRDVNRLLVVDGISCAGETFKWIEKNAQFMFGTDLEVRYAALIARPSTVDDIEFYGRTANTHDYVYFPWEDYSKIELESKDFAPAPKTSFDDEIPF